MSRGSFDFTQIAIPNRSPNVFFFSFVLSLPHSIRIYSTSNVQQCRLALKILWADQNEWQKFITTALPICIEMVKMKIINLHIKCKKLVTQKCGKITQIFIALCCAHFSFRTLNIWNALVFILNIFWFHCGFTNDNGRKLHRIESFQIRLEFI